MAEYLIQDTTLDAIADAINAKTGGSSSMTPAQMVTAIGTISGGGGGRTNDVEVILQNPFDFNVSKLLSRPFTVVFNTTPSSLYGLFEATPYPGNITLDFSNVSFMPPLNNYTSTQKMFAFSSVVGTSTITFIMGNNAYFNAGAQCFSTSRITGIYGAKLLVSASNNTSANAFAGCSKLVDATFLENSLDSFYLTAAPDLSDATLISIANSLKSGDYVLGLHATAKAKLSSIIGTVEQVTDSGTTYDLFVSDEQGETTLLDFITTTKGHTVA